MLFPSSFESAVLLERESKSDSKDPCSNEEHLLHRSVNLDQEKQSIVEVMISTMTCRAET